MCNPEMEQKISEKVFGFSDNCIWIESSRFSQSWIGYLPSGVNVLKNISKISPNSRGDIFQINFPRNDEKTREKCSDGDFWSILDTFTCWLSKSFLKRRFLESFVTKIFTAFKFGNTLPMTTSFLFKIFKICCRFHKRNKKFRKSFSFFR